METRNSYKKLLHKNYIMKNTYVVISDEIERLESWFPITTTTQAAKIGCINEAKAALPEREETPLEWAERNAAWFQCPPVGYRDDFLADVESAGETDFEAWTTK